MRLQIITAQGSSFDDYYAKCPAPTQEAWVRGMEATRKLLRHLEQNVEGPGQWVTITLQVYFHLSDEDDYRPEKARVFIRPASCGWKILYRSARELCYWDSFTLLEASDEAEAGRMVVKALSLAERDLPGIGD